MNNLDKIPKIKRLAEKFGTPMVHVEFVGGGIKFVYRGAPTPSLPQRRQGDRRGNRSPGEAINDRNITKYSDQYIELLFETWYSLGGPEYNQFFKTELPKDEWGRVPPIIQIRSWANEYRWQERKDILNGQALVKAEENLVTQQVSMWKEHADAAAVVRKKALDYIKEKGFDSSASAIQAIKWAQEEERKTRGAEAFIEVVKDKSNDELLSMIRGLAKRQLSTAEEIIEADIHRRIRRGCRI